jgi:hypothetical protein
LPILAFFLFLELSVGVEQKLPGVVASEVVVDRGPEAVGEDAGDVVEGSEGVQVVGVFLDQPFDEGLDQGKRDVGLLQDQNGHSHELGHTHTQLLLLLRPFYVDLQEPAHHLHPRLPGKAQLPVELQGFTQLDSTVLPAEEKFTLFVEGLEDGDSSIIAIAAFTKDLQQHIDLPLRH